MQSREEWLLLVNEFKQNGHSNVKEFSASHQVGYQAFRYWLRKTSYENGEVAILTPADKGKLLPVVIQGKAVVKLHLSVNEVDIYLEPHFDVSFLKSVVATLKEC